MKKRIFSGENDCHLLQSIRQLDATATGDDIRDALNSMYEKCVDLEAEVLALVAAEKGSALLAKIPVLSKELPNSAGDYWWAKKLTDKPKTFRIIYCCEHSRLEWNEMTFDGTALKDMGGWWAKCLLPELPEEGVE